MFDWQNDGQQKQHFYTQEDCKCPTNCGEPESHNHYLHCKDKRMTLKRQERLRLLRQHLTLRNTHPLIINTIIKHLTIGPEDTAKTLDESEDKISKLVKDAVEENMHLSQHSFEKGFISEKWYTAQQEWARRNNANKEYKQKHWRRDIVIEIQTYTYELWKARNEILHGNTTAEKNRKQAGN